MSLKRRLDRLELAEAGRRLNRWRAWLKGWTVQELEAIVDGQADDELVRRFMAYPEPPAEIIRSAREIEAAWAAGKPVTIGGKEYPAE